VHSLVLKFAQLSAAVGISTSWAPRRARARVRLENTASLALQQSHGDPVHGLHVQGRTLCGVIVHTPAALFIRPRSPAPQGLGPERQHPPSGDVQQHPDPLRQVLRLHRRRAPPGSNHGGSTQARAPRRWWPTAMKTRFGWWASCAVQINPSMRSWSVFHLSERLRVRSWQVPCLHPAGRLPSRGRETSRGLRCHPAPLAYSNAKLDAMDHGEKVENARRAQASMGKRIELLGDQNIL